MTDDTERQTISSSERSLADDIRRVARSDTQSGMTLDDGEVQTLSGLLHRLPSTISPVVSDVHRVAATATQGGMTLEDDEVRALASILTAA